VSDRLAGDWVFGSIEALRVNMKSPDGCCKSPARLLLASLPMVAHL
jgi:hypothetical protein